jgi:hypothetical protein
MKMKKFLKRAGIVLLVLVVAAAAGMVIWSATGTYPAGEIAAEALESSEAVLVSNDGWIVFTPQSTPETGLIFYPGGLVEPEAYAPVLRELAEQGVLVVLTPMPLNLAIFNTGAAEAVMEAYPEIKSWLLAGHSLGGAAASIYAENNTGVLDGLALWDSYPPGSADLSDNELAVLSIYGTTGGVPNTDGFDGQRYLLPVDAQYIAIEGASHAQFGDYGPQKGDVVPSISAAEQHEIVAEFMMGFLSR